MGFRLAHDYTLRRRRTWFPRLTDEQFELANLYGIMMYKVAVIVLNIVPCISLYIVG